jgi:methanol metabolism-related c-type cytochrome
MSHRRWLAVPLAIALSSAGPLALDGRAEDSGQPARVQLAQSSTSSTGQDASGQSAAKPLNTDKPYHIAADGTVDWATYNGYRRFNSICETCHGFDGEGSSFGPRLVDTLKWMPYEQFVETVANGKKSVNTAQELVMPALGTDPNVMCYIDDIYTYLRARADGKLGRGRPAKHEPKPQSAIDAENSCMGPS